MRTSRNVCTLCQYDKERGKKSKKYDKRKEFPKEYTKNKRLSWINFNLAETLGSQTNQTFRLQNVSRKIKSTERVACSKYSFKNWIQLPLIRDMTLEKYGSFWHTDQTIP